MPFDQKLEIPEPEYDDPKEVFAFFGLAAYAAQVLERGVLFLALELHLNNAESVTERDIDSLLGGLESRTLGQVIAAIRQMGFPSNLLEERLAEALARRNELAHQFFWDHAEYFMTKGGRVCMIDKLRSLTATFQEADVETEKTLFEVSKCTGFTQEAVNREFAKLKARLHGESEAETLR